MIKKTLSFSLFFLCLTTATLAAIHIKRSLGQITGKGITADGKPVDAWMAPESINTVVIDGREQYLPSPIAQLNWAKAALAMALRGYEKAMTEDR